MRGLEFLRENSVEPMPGRYWLDGLSEEETHKLWKACQEDADEIYNLLIKVNDLESEIETLKKELEVYKGEKNNEKNN